MATYKQKLPRVHVERDSDESEREWVIFNTPNQPTERRLVNDVSDDEDWHVLSDTPIENTPNTPTSGSNSEIASSDYDSEHLQDEFARLIELPSEGQDTSTFMPSHDGRGNFTLFDVPDSLRHVSGSDQDSELLPRDPNESVIPDRTSQDTRHAISTRSDSQESWIAKFRNVFRVEDTSAINSQEQTHQIFHKFAESATSAANLELGDLGNTSPIKVLANAGNENSTTYTTVTTHYVDIPPNQSSKTDHLEKPSASMTSSSASSTSSYTSTVDSSRPEKHASIINRSNNGFVGPKNPMAINFPPTIPENISEMISTENVNSEKQPSSPKVSSHSDKNSLLSTVWTTICRITNIESDDTDLSNHNTHNTGLASIITGENHYDTSYLPFGNILALSELCPPLHSYKNHYSSSSSPSISSYNKRRNSTTSPNTARIFLSPVSSSTSLKSFASRAGSDCGLESGRGMGRNTSLETPLVL